ncbi:alpha/beta hydrolase [Kitasatospora sp. NPDC096147]|uniref:alpha/beta hydrolase n=1 Tax=Kitasatospora sp. NPDC096147 TaxID=3364093 RepID=UPI00381DD47F
MTTDPQNSRSTYGRSRSRRALALAAAALLAVGVAAPASAAATTRTTTAADSAATPTTGRGALLSVTPLERLSTAQLTAFAGNFGVDTGTVRHGITAYRLTYRTVTPQGAPTTATGLFVLPQGGPRRLAVVSDTHGTMVHRDYAPSTAEDFGKLSPYLQSSAGRAVAAPDYLGLGLGPGLHPYMDTRSAVSASLDLLRAADEAGRRLGRPLTGDVYATGFSQGGQVAMALGRELARISDRHLRLRGLAPVAGPHDVRGAELPGILDGRVDERSAVFYLSYYLTAANRLHPLYRDPSEVFRAPYAAVVEGLFDTRHTEEEVVAALPGTVRELLTDSFHDQLGAPGPGLSAALDATDGGCDWRPAAPVRLYAANGDRDVPIANSRSCAADLAKHGVRAAVLDQGPVGHFDTLRLATPQIIRWFDALDR